MIATFLAENDFSGKTIIPFCTSSSDDIGNSLQNDIEPWLQSLGLVE
ncbi:hypothetical protein OCV99_08425 [Dorea acetigenes]|jgi:hypothetical protein|uniref:Flavodoxin-like domain-containing protein n=1 Tax=Dorea acetigenes TaxID=2981787 RepID=A0ABT2RMC6_9FIRM|nr:flavodoxin [Dorea acetigenes]MCU6686573.1 hypothetical protein [Dorea acetigenes]